MPTEIYYKVDFNISIHDVRGSEVVVEPEVKVSPYFTIAHVKTCALRGTRGISLETPCDPTYSITYIKPHVKGENK